MNSTQNLTKIPSAAELLARIQNIGNQILETAAVLVAAIDARPELVPEMIEAGGNRELIHRLERLGRGQMHPSLIFNTSPGGQRLLKLPLSEQNRTLAGGVEVLDADETSTRIIQVNELTGKQASQVFHGGVVRSIAEQRTWLRDHKPRKVDVDSAYRVFGDHVLISAPGKFSKKLILQWLTEMA